MSFKLSPEQIEIFMTRLKGLKMSFKLSSEQAPEFLFKYSPINANFLDAVRHHYLWLSRPIDFNDPFDSRILLDINSPVEEIVEQMGAVLEIPETKEEARNLFTKIKAFDPVLFHELINVPYLKAF